MGDLQSGTNVAGTWMRIERNAFLCPRRAVVIRGVPEQEVLVTGNWCVHDGPRHAIAAEDRTRAAANAYGAAAPRVIRGR